MRVAYSTRRAPHRPRQCPVSGTRRPCPEIAAPGDTLLSFPGASKRSTGPEGQAMACRDRAAASLITWLRPPRFAA